MTKNKRIFYPGYYYLVDVNNNVIMHDTDIKILRQYAEDTDMICVCLSAKPSKETKPKVVKPSKIVFDFDKKTLTVEGGCAKIGKEEYKEGEHTDINLDTWVSFVEDVNKACDNVEYVGTPPIDGKDITNEMSDLQ